MSLRAHLIYILIPSCVCLLCVGFSQLIVLQSASQETTDQVNNTAAIVRETQRREAFTLVLVLKLILCRFFISVFKCLKVKTKFGANRFTVKFLFISFICCSSIMYLCFSSIYTVTDLIFCIVNICPQYSM